VHVGRRWCGAVWLCAGGVVPPGCVQVVCWWCGAAWLCAGGVQVASAAQVGAPGPVLLLWGACTPWLVGGSGQEGFRGLGGVRGLQGAPQGCSTLMGGAGLVAVAELCTAP